MFTSIGILRVARIVKDSILCADLEHDSMGLPSSQCSGPIPTLGESPDADAGALQGAHADNPLFWVEPRDSFQPLTLLL